MDKDIYEYILYFCDDYTVVNAILAYAKIYKRREEVYERLMKRRYPGCEKWKEKDKTWTRYFIKFGNFIAILKIRFDIPYFEGLNPEKFYLQVKNTIHENVQILVIHEAIRSKNLNAVKLFIERLEDTKNISTCCICTAVQINSLEIVKYFCEKFSHDGQINHLAGEAIFLNRMDILDYLLQKGANNYDLFLLEACHASNFPLVELMISKGATSFHSALDHANDPEIRKYLRTFI